MSTIPYVHGRHEPRFSAVYTFNKPSRRRNLADGDVDFKQLKKDIERDKILTSAEAVEYGLIDQVLASRKAKA